MRGLIRRPLTWMIVAECVVAAALVVVAWRMLSEPTTTPGSPLDVFPAPLASPGALPTVPVVAGMPPTARGPLPGLNVSPEFWRTRLHILNAETAAFEALEWRVTRAVIKTVRGYVDSVILPAIRQAERRAAVA